MSNHHFTRGSRVVLAAIIGLVMVLAGPSDYAVAYPVDQQSVSDIQVDALLAQLGPEDRVGQLFFVSFYGPYTAESEIAHLVSQYRIGGVMLSLRNNNFDDLSPLPDQVKTTSTVLQQLASERRQLSPSETGAEQSSPEPYIPLFIGLSDDRTDIPRYENLPGFTALPSAMALGSAWDWNNSSTAGEILGSELNAVGVNVVLGPSADVVEVPPPPASSGDLGTWVFGGEPFWVSQHVHAYVAGLSTGSHGRLLVILPHFPGHGGADRLASVEVPTVRRSLEQLSQFDLIPFIAATSTADDKIAVGGLMTDHIRYLGFQGDNIRVATRPISLDPQALLALMRLDSLAAWRSAGGIIMSDSLGAQGIRRYYGGDDPGFPNRRIAQDALVAGNDLLYLSEYGIDPENDQAATVIDTIDYFVQAYNEDPAFRSRVDDAVRRILKSKLTLYGEFNLSRTISPVSTVSVNSQSDFAFGVAQQAVTLLSPSKADQLTSPQTGDRIVIFTDSRMTRLCDTCTATPEIPVNGLEAAIDRLYGPQASALGLGPIDSFTFDELASYLETGPLLSSGLDQTPVPNPIDQALQSADWVVFVMREITPTVPSSDVVKRFLAVPRVSQQTQIVVAAMDAPYYLDSTEISKLTAYYGVYGTSSPFVDAAARALLLGVPFSGASPVTVSGINYTILDATSPGSSQVITLTVQVSDAGASETTPAASPVLELGDTVTIVTGRIVDRNGNPVPDGTPTDFLINYVTQNSRTTLTGTTASGVASTSFVLDRVGEIEITAQSAPAANSDRVQIFVSDTGDATIIVVPPEITPTKPAAPVTNGTPDGIELSGATPETPRVSGFRLRFVDLGDLALTFVALLMLGSLLMYFGARYRDLNFGLMLALMSAVFGLVSYLAYAMGLPGFDIWGAVLGQSGAVGGVAISAGTLGGGGTFLLLLLGAGPRRSVSRKDLGNDDSHDKSQNE